MPDTFLIYRASAGTGKTFSLVKEYLAIVLKEPDGFKRTLAITFTNKAAEEMKSRILQHLANIAAGRDDTKAETWLSMVPALQLATGLNEDLLVHNAGIVLGNILHNYSFFSVGTIDSFANAIVQTFAREMELPANFELELDSTDIISDAVNLLVSRVGEDETITNILVNYLRHKMSENKHLNIVAELNTFAGKMLREEGMEQRNKLAEYTPEDFLEKEMLIKQAVEQYRQEVLRIAKPVWEKIKHLCHALSYAERGIAGFFKKLTTNPLDMSSNANAGKTIENGKWCSAKATSAEKAEIGALQPFIETAYTELLALQEKNKTRIIIFQEILKNLYATMLINEINRAIIELREEHGIVHISELNKRIADVIHQDSIPFIYERIGTRYRNYLIDEFQDTSVLQWNNFIPLILNALSESGLSMIVGDGKQAIYRWRSGDVEQFERLSVLTESIAQQESEQIFKQHIKLERLQQNFRSEQAVVAFNNRLFEFAKRYIPAGYKELENVYSDSMLEYVPTKPNGFVSVNFLPESEDTTYEEKMCEATHTKVQQLTERGYAYADIAILCRFNKEAAAIAQYLIEQEIPVASSESLMLTASPDVNLMCAALIYFAVPDASNRAIFWLQLWKTKSFLWNDEVMEQINSMPHLRFQEHLKEYGINIDFNLIAKSTLLDAAVLLANAFEMNITSDVYLRFFLDGLIDAQSKDISALSDFPEWWNKKGSKQSLVIPENADAIKVMTIHKAKGLGFPVVLYPFADDKFKNAINDIWIDLNPDEYFLPAALLPLNKTLLDTNFASYYNEEQAKSVLDMLNVFYVACTRPKEELHIISRYQEKWKDETPSLADMLHNFLDSEGLWEDEKVEYNFGAPFVRTKTGQEETSGIEAKELKSIVSWQERVSIRRYSRQFWSSEQIDYGNMVHSLLEKINTSADIKPALQQLLVAGVVSANELSNVEAILKRVTTHPELQHLFNEAHEVFCETAILLPDNREVRPDRMVLIDGKMHILDYKTGEERPEYSRQLEHYAEVMTQMNYEVASARLVYINGEEVRVVRSR